MDFGMLFSRVCFHYGFSFECLMRLPVKTFWMLNKNIGRLLAEKDLRALSVAVASQNAESFASKNEQLVVELDNPYKVEAVPDETRDEDGFNDLKRMARGL